MGNLIIKKVEYYGDNYQFISSDLETGINLIIGDNGSGKSTFVYFIEYALGGTIKPFSLNNKEKYLEILHDKNNYVKIEVEINNNKYFFKRFINNNDILISDDKENITMLPINRNKNNKIFSDWILEKLNIPSYELNYGSYAWKFNFNDLIRLLIYDQDTEAKKIYKSPISENFINDSIVIRKAIFETLLGISSIEFFKLHDELKNAEKEKDIANKILLDFIDRNGEPDYDINKIDNRIKDFEEYLDKIIYERDLYQGENVKINDKTEHLSKIQSDIINNRLNISELTVKKKNISIELNNVKKLFQDLNFEISEINKIIFTNDKLNLFSLEMCPFCMSEKHPVEGQCICGEKYKNDDYEKFVYDTSEYKIILQHKQKSLQTISKAISGYEEEIKNLDDELNIKTENYKNLETKLTKIINSIEYSGNSQLIDDFNEKILESKLKIQDEKGKKAKLLKYNELLDDFENKKNNYKKTQKQFKITQEKFEFENQNTIKEFNVIFNDLMKKSSAKIDKAKIDNEYLPIVDDGTYKNKSTNVSKRLMYFYTILALSLKLENVKHPKLLIIDTPETDGIDDENLKHDLDLLNYAIKISNTGNKTYQVILTTGKNKYPNSFSANIKQIFNSNAGEFILKKVNYK